MGRAAFKTIERKRNPGQRDYRPLAMVAVAVMIGGVGYLVQWLPGRGVVAASQPAVKVRPGFDALPVLSAKAQPTGIEQEPNAEAKNSAVGSGTLEQALKQADALIAEKKYDDAIRTINRVRPLAGSSAQAYRLVGRALMGRGDHATARDFFAKAIDLNPTFAQAYFDHASASEGLGDLESAIGGMRSFLHIVKNPDPFRLQVAQARSAIWEWEAKLGRGPWGPTKGIPPGFTADQIKRDGKGVGTMMQKPETLRPDGTMDYEIKAGDRYPNLWKK